MNFNEYQVLANRTSNKELDFSTSLAVAALGLVGEAAEVSEMVKKHLGHGHELDFLEIEKELGDTLWYIAELCSLLGMDMTFTAQRNIAKLKARYPEGFSEEASVNRNEK